MKHARPDYDRIQDPAELIPEDEPVFLLRAQDSVAAATVLEWARLSEAAGASPEIIRLARDHVKRMAEWRPHKVADLPGDKT